MITDK